jgi:hypothetical protein
MNKRTRICPAVLDGRCDGKARNSVNYCDHYVPHSTNSLCFFCGSKCERLAPETLIEPCLVIPKKLAKVYAFRVALNGIDISGWQDD